MQEPDLQAIEAVAKRFRPIREYGRLHVDGLDKLPEGPFVLVANHTGWAGLDYANLFLTLYDHAGRLPRVAVHPSYFRFRPVQELAEKLGFFEASVGTAAEILDKRGVVAFFPEGEAGNFKPIWKRYRLQPFKPGFARVALATEAPVVPVVIVGGEDANPTLGRWKALEHVVEAPVPIPLSVLPLPAKWRIAFLDPIDPARYLRDGSPDKDVAEVMARDVRNLMQVALDEQLRLRGNPFV